RLKIIPQLGKPLASPRGGYKIRTHAYLFPECEEESTNPVKFWKLKSQELPTLACMVRTHILVPASSAPCEHGFSAGQYIQN
ncbi:uncharacterized protein VP01_3252g1, partial [Puccinia sorghi]